MTRYIDADKLIQALCNTQKTWGSRLGTSWWSHSVKLKDNMVRCIKEQPTADVVEVKHGEWEVCSDEYEICASEFVCSNCKENFCSSELTDEQFFEMLKFCPHCGAKMDGGKAE